LEWTAALRRMLKRFSTLAPAGAQSLADQPSPPLARKLGRRRQHGSAEARRDQEEDKGAVIPPASAGHADVYLLALRAPLDA